MGTPVRPATIGPLARCCSRRFGVPALLLLAIGGCSGEVEEPADLSAQLVRPPLVRRVVVPGVTPPPDLWGAEYEVEIRETACAGVALSFVQIQVFDEGFGLPFGTPDPYDRARLQDEGLSQLPPCGDGLVFSGFTGSIGGAEPRGPARVTVRVIGVDERGNSIGLDATLQSPVEASPDS